jgi:hypothetical protein
MIRKTLFSIALVAVSAGLFAQNLPVPSPRAKVMQTVGLAEITVDYARPSVNERTIFGNIVPYGTMWRTGANKATSIEVSQEVALGDNCRLAPGKYSIFTIPNKDSWVVIINSETELWGTGNYPAEKEVCKFEVPAIAAKDFYESFTITFDNVTQQSAELSIKWEQTKILIKVSSDPVEPALANIKKAISDVENASRVYHNAASFYLDFNVDNAKALEYAQKAVDNGGADKFWIVTTLSKAYAANKDYKKAIETAEKAMEMAKKANYDAYITINQENINKWKKAKK